MFLGGSYFLKIFFNFVTLNNTTMYLVGINIDLVEVLIIDIFNIIEVMEQILAALKVSID